MESIYIGKRRELVKNILLLEDMDLDEDILNESGFFYIMLVLSSLIGMTISDSAMGRRLGSDLKSDFKATSKVVRKVIDKIRRLLGSKKAKQKDVVQMVQYLKKPRNPEIVKLANGIEKNLGKNESIFNETGESPAMVMRRNLKAMDLPSYLALKTLEHFVVALGVVVGIGVVWRIARFDAKILSRLIKRIKKWLQSKKILRSDLEKALFTLEKNGDSNVKKVVKEIRKKV